MAAWQEMPLSGNKRKKGGVIALWSLGTLCLACLAAQGAAGGDPSLKCEDLRVGQYPEAARRQRLVAMVMGLAMGWGGPWGCPFSRQSSCDLKHPVRPSHHFSGMLGRSYTC